MFKIKKEDRGRSRRFWANVIEDYSEFDAPGNVTACAMTLPENIPAHAKILSESYDVPLDQMTQLLSEGGVYVYPQVGACSRAGSLPAVSIQRVPRRSRPGCWISCSSEKAEQWARARASHWPDAAGEIFYRTLPRN